MDNYRESIRKSLLESYKHRIETQCSCSMCGKKNLPLAFHMLEASFVEGADFPSSFVPMSSSFKVVHGSYPICISCAPKCKKCGLPVPSEKIMEFGHQLNADYGNGMCEHIQFGLFISALFKRLFKIGRFGK